MAFFFLLTLPLWSADSQLLTETLTMEKDPRWSPDGEAVAFSRYRRGAAHIWVIRHDGTGAHQVSFGAGDHIQPEWSPGGDKLVFVSTGDPNGVKLSLLHIEDGTTSRLTSGDGVDSHPSWSPDRTTIAFARSHEDEGQHLWFLDTGTGKVRQITQGPANEGFPRWSPDGQRLAFVVFTEDYAYLAVTERDHWDQPHKITPMAGVRAWPSWSPDGTSIIFGFRDGEGWQVRIVSADGSHARKVSLDSPSPFSPDHHPKHATLVYVTTQNGIFDLRIDSLQVGR